MYAYSWSPALSPHHLAECLASGINQHIINRNLCSLDDHWQLNRWLNWPIDSRTAAGHVVLWII